MKEKKTKTKLEHNIGLAFERLLREIVFLLRNLNLKRILFNISDVLSSYQMNQTVHSSIKFKKQSTLIDQPIDLNEGTVEMPHREKTVSTMCVFPYMVEVGL